MDQNRKLLTALIAASTALGVIIFFMIFFWIYHRKRLQKCDKDSNHSSDVAKGIALAPDMCKFNSLKSTYSRKASVSLMEYKTLESATNKFQESEILGEGGFGCVYKARLEDNLYVAVKKLEGGTRDAIKEFETEVELLSQMQHPNIISLLGYCIHGETRLIVYELMLNGSLESQLHGIKISITQVSIKLLKITLLVVIFLIR